MAGRPPLDPPHRSRGRPERAARRRAPPHRRPVLGGGGRRGVASSAFPRRTSRGCEARTSPSHRPTSPARRPPSKRSAPALAAGACPSSWGWSGRPPPASTMWPSSSSGTAASRASRRRTSCPWKRSRSTSRRDGASCSRWTACRSASPSATRGGATRRPSGGPTICRSIGAATDAAIVSALAPGKVAVIWMVGKSTAGSADTPRRR